LRDFDERDLELALTVVFFEVTRDREAVAAATFDFAAVGLFSDCVEAR
jgi:hypothetical protein